ncbi:universal stress protein [Hyphomicrobium sp.]|uniref:universal stress protein n=1 Tax=Hyphomicrobium sp. TaxID=82 RepID=UPI0025B8EB64|nr:universal stress protein [Hyphomicrobium sp.]MCC7254248.1 universal stress protein [Hyphomicrobium sp.]
MKGVLAATDFSTRSQRAVRRAGLIARQAGAALTLLHIVDEDRPERLVELEQAEARKILDEQVASIPELRGVECRTIVATGAAHDAILRAAGAISADLIVMGTHRKQLLRDIFVGTTIERVIRCGTWPVLMVNTQALRPYANVLVAADLSDASAAALRAAHALGFLAASRVTIMHAYEAMAKPKMLLADVPKDKIDAYVEEERQRSLAELDAFIASLPFDPGPWTPHVVEGEAPSAISEAVQALSPELLVVGTHGRSGAAKILLGSVAEQVLRALEIDILAVPRAAAHG